MLAEGLRPFITEHVRSSRGGGYWWAVSCCHTLDFMLTHPHSVPAPAQAEIAKQLSESLSALDRASERELRTRARLAAELDAAELVSVLRRCVCVSVLTPNAFHPASSFRTS